MALQAALSAVGWRVRPNFACLRASSWPVVAPEADYPGAVLLQPVDSFALAGAVYTDGSVSQMGGAAAVQPDEEVVRTAKISAPRSSTQCELVALALALELQPAQILTDSLAALCSLKTWGTWSPQRVLQTADRALVRLIVHKAGQLAMPPLLEKVKAHDHVAIALGHPKAVGNEVADGWAKRAATEAGHADWIPPPGLHDDPVILEDAAGNQIWDVRQQLVVLWWDRRHRSTARARPLLERLYPKDVEVDWSASCGIFRRPVVPGNQFVHPAPPAVIKWMARVRTGCLATRMRLVGHEMASGPTVCICCGVADEDEEHLLTGCVATGAAEWLTSVLEIWRATAQGHRVAVPDPPRPWLEQHSFMLLAALLPVGLAADCEVPGTAAPRFLAALHRGLAAATAERLWRREELLAETRASTMPQPAAGLGLPPGAAMAGQLLPVERRFSVQELRQVEAARRREQPLVVVPAKPAAVALAVPVAGETRRR